MLDKLKEELRITWNDEDVSLQSLLKRGMKRINRLIGVDLNYEDEDLPQELLFNYCRYSRNNAMEFFLDNFAEDILFLQLQEAAKEKEVRENE